MVGGDIALSLAGHNCLARRFIRAIAQAGIVNADDALHVVVGEKGLLNRSGGGSVVVGNPDRRL